MRFRLLPNSVTLDDWTA